MKRYNKIFIEKKLPNLVLNVYKNMDFKSGSTQSLSTKEKKSIVSYIKSKYKTKVRDVYKIIEHLDKIKSEIYKGTDRSFDKEGNIISKYTFESNPIDNLDKENEIKLDQSILLDILNFELEDEKIF